jgi:electron-transferring-flavoprotein dehydrogenase
MPAYSSVRRNPRHAGAHILSGNVLQPNALNELLPHWREDADCPIRQPATASRFYYLTRGAAMRLPNPPQMAHKGNYVVSLRQALPQSSLLIICAC